MHLLFYWVEAVNFIKHIMRTECVYDLDLK